MPQDFFRRAAWRGYLLAIFAWAVAFGVRYGLAHWFPPGFPYLTFFPAVVLVAYYAGLRPAVLTATLSGLTAWWFWIGPPGFDLAVATLVALGFYIFVAAVDIFFIVGMDGASRRLAREVERNAALAESRDILLREVQHRVSNNIQVVSALLSLEARAAADPGARKALADASTRTALVASIQRSLADAEQQATAFEDLARTIVDDALAAAARDDVVVSISSGEVALSAEEATPVVLIMLECVNNALEHAFPDRPGRITIELCDHGEIRTLVIADDGVGVSEAASAEPGSLGLRIIKALARQLGGQWSLRSADTGACARLSWPSAAASRRT
ncbi:histidine kinase dimerization/phosphoacceptor domain -containing protein [Brevundimonas sp.]|uniref:sensor histidine kinase n=1 Tax=Brevundimonas sp. TaxID=1871086 RepID=UPI0026161030|nr:histidine kinase dimerization/phosphoacceptor domain -containing protein [Brevundimonas sp.]